MSFDEKVTDILWSQIIEQFECDRFRLIVNESFNGLPAQLLNKWSTWGTKA